MKKIIRLTEQDLARIVRRVIKEQEYKEGESAQADLEKYATDNYSDYKKGNSGNYTTYTYDGNKFQITIAILSQDKSYEKGRVNICITKKGGSYNCDKLNSDFWNKNWTKEQFDEVKNTLQRYTK